jgi:hypothetical protein
MSNIDTLIRKERAEAREALAFIYQELFGQPPPFWYEARHTAEECLAAISRLKQTAAGQHELWKAERE